jgi:hypothetical protein
VATSTFYDSGALAITSTGDWKIDTGCTVNTTTTWKCTTGVLSTQAGVPVAKTATINATSTEALVLKITGSGTNANDVILERYTLEWCQSPAAT